MLFSRTQLQKYGKLYGLDCLSIKEKQRNLNEFVFNEFGEKFGRSPGGITKPFLFGKWTIPSYYICGVYGHSSFHTTFKNHFELVKQLGKNIY